jgi:hypothetical protein
MNNENQHSLSICQKYNLTVAEASDYFGIGEKKLRQIVDQNPTADYVLYNGVKILIKRRKFEEFIDETNSI